MGALVDLIVGFISDFVEMFVDFVKGLFGVD